MRSSIPKMGSLASCHDLNAPMPGLDALPRTDRPSSAILFWSFRIMVGLGLLMALLGLLSLIARLRRRLYDWRLLHRFALVMGPSGFVAVICRLDHHRGRPPALGDLRPAAHRGRRCRRSRRRA